MGRERRRAPRLKVDLPARWEGIIDQREATVTSLSTNGCFLLSGGEVQPKELIRVEMVLPDSTRIYLWGEVVDHAYEIGFAVQFTLVEDEPHRRLTAFLLTALSDPALKDVD